MKIKEAYNFLFYTFYTFWESVSIPTFWSDAKAIFSITVLEAFIMYSIIAYYRVLINPHSHFGEGVPENLIMFVVSVIPNCILFLRNDYGIKIAKEYDKLPNHEKRVGKMVSWILCGLIISNFVFAFYLLFTT